MPPTDGADLLVIEDDDDFREELEGMLGRWGFTVHPAGDGQRGLELLMDGLRPRLIMLDLVMPGMCGRDVLARLRDPRSCWAAIPVLVLSATPRPALPGGVPVLAKPFDLPDLQARLDALMGAPNA